MCVCVCVCVCEKVPAELCCALWIVYNSPAVPLRTEQSCARIAPTPTRSSPLVMHRVTLRVLAVRLGVLAVRLGVLAVTLRVLAATLGALAVTRATSDVIVCVCQPGLRQPMPSRCAFQWGWSDLMHLFLPLLLSNN